MEQIILEIQRHIAIINDELGQVQIDVAVLKSQVGELIWMQRIVLGLIVAFVIGQLLKMISNKRNNK